LNLDPSFDGRNAVLRFIAPSNGTYRVLGRFIGLDNSTTDASLLLNGKVFQAGLITGKGVMEPFDYVFTMDKGGTIDFSVGQGTGGPLFDGTGLKLRIEQALPDTNFRCLNAPFRISLWLPAEGTPFDVISSNQVQLLQGAAYDQGVIGQGFSLAGQANYIAIADSPSVRPLTNLTLEGWFKFNEPGLGTLQTLAGKTVGSGFRNSYAMFYLNGQLHGIVGSAESFGSDLIAPFRPQVGVWHHLAYTFNDGLNFQALYVDGFLVASNSTDQTIGYVR